MQNIRPVGQGADFENQIKFFPRVDTLISDARILSDKPIATRVLVKSYIALASMGHSYFTCKCGEYTQSLLYAANTFGTQNATIDKAVSGTGQQNGEMRWKFAVDEGCIEEADFFADKYRLSGSDRAFVKMRFGMGYQSVFTAAQAWHDTDQIRLCLRELRQSEIPQLVLLQGSLDAQLTRSGGNITLAVERVRHGVDVKESGIFGKEVYKYMNRLIAQGHHNRV